MPRTNGPPTLLALCLVGLLVVLDPEWVGACSRPGPGPIFTYRAHPDLPLRRFAEGRLGIVSPKWPLTFQVVAYRHMAGIGVDAVAAQALEASWARRWGPGVLGHGVGGDGPAAALANEWIRALQEFRPHAARVNPNRYVADVFVHQPNCLEDGFRTATATLRARVAQFGAESAIVGAWLDAQQQVFSNCSGPDSIPASLGPEADPFARADREYQIASAFFYAWRFDEAAMAFRRIGLDGSSPWRALARHLVARCLIRKAMLAGKGFDRAGLEAAQDELRTILGDPSLVAVHPGTRRLMGFVQARLDPGRASAEGIVGVVSLDAGADLPAYIDNYRAAFPSSSSADDLAFWLQAINVPNLGNAAQRQALVERSCERALKSGQQQWLVAALIATPADDPRIDGLLAVAQRVDIGQPGGPTVAFHSARQHLARGSASRAREILDGLLGEGEERLGRSSYNLALRLRASAASDLAELLRYTARRAVAWIDLEDKAELPLVEARDDADRFDDAAAATVSWLPLPLQIAAIEKEILPESLRAQLAGSAWVRAVVLRRDDLALRAGARLVALAPGVRPEFQPFLTASSAEARAHAALMILLRRPHTPVVIPLVSLAGTAPPPQGIALADADRGSFAWSQGVDRRWDESLPPWWGWEEVDAQLPAFLDRDQRNVVRRDWDALQAVGSGPEFFCARAIEWAQARQQDPLVPEALHRAVASSRWAADSARMGMLSHQAFRILHQRFPNSPWTAKTPYWYKGR